MSKTANGDFSYTVALTDMPASRLCSSCIEFYFILYRCLFL